MSDDPKDILRQAWELLETWRKKAPDKPKLFLTHRELAWLTEAFGEDFAKRDDIILIEPPTREDE